LAARGGGGNGRAVAFDYRPGPRPDFGASV